MASAKTITINGRSYDAVTGMLLDTPADTGRAAQAAPAAAAPREPKPPRAQTAAGSLHGTQQRSKTLHRRAAKKPAATLKQAGTTRPTTGQRHMDIARSPKVSRFAPHPVTKTAAAKATSPAPVAAPAPKPAAKPAPRPTSRPDTPDRAPQPHPLAVSALSKAEARKRSAAPAAAVSPKQKKESQIAKAMATPVKKPQAAKKSLTKKMTARNKKYFYIAVFILAILLLAITAYKIFPGISVSIAASRAGISATYPEYTPDGYALHQPVTFKEGEVALTFQSNSNTQSYTITQQRSSWDSSSVLDNIVQPAAGNNYITTKERGLTIFTYGNTTTWMNGGLLYTIQGDAQLSSDQVRRIVTSL